MHVLHQGTQIGIARGKINVVRAYVTPICAGGLHLHYGSIGMAVKGHSKHRSFQGGTYKAQRVNDLLKSL